MSLSFAPVAHRTFLAGVGAYGAARLVHGLRLGVAAGADRVGEGHNGEDVAWNVGLLAGVGAPFDSTRFGLLLQTGYLETLDTARGRSKSFTEHLYGRGALVMQFSSNSTSRMWVGLSPMVLTKWGGEPNVFLGLDLGGAWDPT
jgi:hypothetical protein